jgi:hypothetical protein
MTVSVQIGLDLTLTILRKCGLMSKLFCNYVRSEVLKAKNINITRFWDAMPCTLVDTCRHWCFGETCYLHVTGTRQTLLLKMELANL